MKLTLLDIQKRNEADLSLGIIEEVALSAPEVTELNARTIKGTSMKVLRRTGVPKVVPRPANAGANHVSSTWENINVELKYLDALVVVDKQVLDSAEDGEAQVLASEAEGVALGAVLSIGQSNIYGTDLGLDYYPGFRQLVDDSMVLSATSDTTQKAGTNSIYAINDGLQGVQQLFGNGKAFSMEPFKDNYATDAKGKQYAAKMSNLQAHVGLAVYSKHAVGMLTNLGGDVTVNDDLIGKLIALFPPGRKPTALYMTRKHVQQLRQSRTNAGLALAGGVAPTPTDVEGIKIIETDSIIEDESKSKDLAKQTMFN